LRRALALVFVLSVAAMWAATASAGHSSGIHWFRVSNPYTVRLIDSTSGAWKDAVAGAASKWSEKSSVIDIAVEDDAAMTDCPHTPGAVRVCSGKYPQGWVGLTTLRMVGKHIESATIRLDDSAGSAKKAVACHEIGHALGLEHRPAAQKTSCLTANVSPAQRRPDRHDIRQLKNLYGHSDLVPAKPGDEMEIIRIPVGISR
jgi:hypothetical protein